jgi:hypothetical protein
MQKDICLGSTNKMTSGSKTKDEKQMLSWLATTWEKQNFDHNMGVDILCNLSHFVPTFCPTQGYMLRFLALTHHICATSGMLPPKSHTNASFYMILIL